MWRVLHADALLGIIITGVVFGTVLAGQVHHHGIGTWVNAGFHYFAPAWALAGWLLFGPGHGWTGQRSAGFSGRCCGSPTRSPTARRPAGYPYPFLAAHVHGYGITFRNTAAVIVLTLVLAGILRVLDQRLPTITL